MTTRQRPDDRRSAATTTWRILPIGNPVIYDSVRTRASDKHFQAIYGTVLIAGTERQFRSSEALKHQNITTFMLLAKCGDILMLNCWTALTRVARQCAFRGLPTPKSPRFSDETD